MVLKGPKILDFCLDTLCRLVPLINTRYLPQNDFVIVYKVYLFFQDDVVTGTLTVRENLHFSAALRLPSNMTYTERKERVNRVIDELGLQNCADQKVYVHCCKIVFGCIQI